MTQYVGVDYHQSFSFVTVMNEMGGILQEGRVANSRAALASFLTSVSPGNEPRTAVLEATRNWTVMYDWLEELVDDVQLAHPLKVKAIAEAKIKTDKIDARALAHLLRTQLLPTAHVPGPIVRDIRSVLRHRLFLIRLRTMVKNRIVGMVDRYPDVARERPCKHLFSRAGLAWLQTLPCRETDRTVLQADVALLADLNQRIDESNELIASLAEGNEQVSLLKTIPGIGDFFAVLIAAEVDDIRRFAHEKKFFSYMGLVPSTYSSGGKTFHGRLTKQGNRYLRWALVEAVWPAIRSDEGLRVYYHRLQSRKGPNPAKVATARRLATIVYRVLSEHRAYRPFGSKLP